MAFPFPDDLVFVRTYVQWDPPTDDDLNARYDLIRDSWFRDPRYTGSYDTFDIHGPLRIEVATQFVRQRLSQFLDEPDSFSIAGEYSESNGRNPAVLAQYLAELNAMSPSGGVSIGRFVRADGDQRGVPCIGGPRVSGVPTMPGRGYR